MILATTSTQLLCYQSNLVGVGVGVAASLGQLCQQSQQSQPHHHHQAANKLASQPRSQQLSPVLQQTSSTPGNIIYIPLVITLLLVENS